MFRLVTIVLAVLTLGAGVVAAHQFAVAPGNEHFQRTWERTDRPVLDGIVARTWMWAPEAFTEVLSEPYAESPDGIRDVQYFDKARMEITNPDAGDPNSVWYVTNGLLVVEMVTGDMQVGDSTFEQRLPAEVNVAGDADDLTGPTYQTFGVLLDVLPSPEGSIITQRVDRDANVTDDPSLADEGVTVAIIDEVTNQSIATPFWEFMNSSGIVYESGQLITDQLFENAYFPSGRPITEPYWANVKVGGSYRDVLIQCFERRCLTYTPGNPDGFVVEAGNVGRHYYQWRYDLQQSPTATPVPTATPDPTQTPVAPPMPITTSGTGDTLTESIELSDGLGVFTLSHDGSSNFIVWIYDEASGERVDLLVNEIGPFDAQVAIEIPDSGNYLYEVSADGDWTIEVIQPTPSNWETVNAPIELTGTGRDVRLFVFIENGLRRIEMTHDGSSNFIVWVYNSDASDRDLLVNEIGPYSGSAGLQVGDDIFGVSDPGSGGVFAVFDIEADANWTIDIE